MDGHMTRAPATPAPRILRGGGGSDAVVYELLSRRQFFFDGEPNGSLESIPLPVFDTTRYKSGVLSLAISQVSGFAFLSRVQVWIQNAVQVADDPAVIFAEDGIGLTVEATPTPPVLKTDAWTPIGPGARLLIRWQPGTGVASATTTFGVYLTLRSR
jgi:hypothetical protein